MEVIEKAIEFKRPDKFYLYPLGDFHLGAVHCDEDLIREKVAEIKANPKALWLGMGDYGDCITPNDLKRWDARILAPWLLDDMDTRLPVWMRSNVDNIGPAILDRIASILSPIWNKCLGLIEGNHDDGIRKHNHYNFMKELLKRANEKYTVPYAGVQCLVNLKFQRTNTNDRHAVLIHARHGEGSARTSGARALAVLRMIQSFPTASITLMAHLHGQESPDIPQRMGLIRGRLKAFDSLATMTGAWLLAYKQDAPPSYLERYGSPPSKLGCPCIIIEPDKGKITLEKTARSMTL